MLMHRETEIHKKLEEKIGSRNSKEYKIKLIKIKKIALKFEKLYYFLRIFEKKLYLWIIKNCF
jgi:hypothetical protein